MTTLASEQVLEDIFRKEHFYCSSESRCLLIPNPFVDASSPIPLGGHKTREMHSDQKQQV